MYDTRTFETSANRRYRGFKFSNNCHSFVVIADFLLWDNFADYTTIIPQFIGIAIQKIMSLLQFIETAIPTDVIENTEITALCFSLEYRIV